MENLQSVGLGHALRGHGCLGRESEGILVTGVEARLHESRCPAKIGWDICKDVVVRRSQFNQDYSLVKAAGMLSQAWGSSPTRPGLVLIFSTNNPSTCTGLFCLRITSSKYSKYVAYDNEAASELKHGAVWPDTRKCLMLIGSHTGQSFQHSAFT